ncbi:hypothetical protein ACJJTC_012719 [Scirpophaga incertulas]
MRPFQRDRDLFQVLWNLFRHPLDAQRSELNEQCYYRARLGKQKSSNARLLSFGAVCGLECCRIDLDGKVYKGSSPSHVAAAPLAGARVARLVLTGPPFHLSGLYECICGLLAC